MDNCKDKVQLVDFEANVITLAMIQEAVDEALTSNKDKKSQSALGLVKEESGAARETDLEMVKTLMLPVKGIYRIDYLWILPNLTDLNLSCNRIQCIENINCLSHLTKLNLACNQIKKIENIDQLSRLEIFMIHNNRLTRVDNLDQASNLKIFNVKNNHLESLEDAVLYLRQFKVLRSLCVDGNPGCETFQANVDEYIIAYLPQLEYLEYNLVTKTMREKHREHYAKDIERIEEEERKKDDENSREKNDDKDLSDLKLAFIENLNRSQLFELMTDRDPYSHIMVMMKGEMPNIYERYGEEFSDHTQQLFQMGKEEYLKREQDLCEFRASFKKLKADVNEKNRQIVENFIAEKAFIFYDISQLIQEIEQESVVEQTSRVENVKNHDSNNHNGPDDKHETSEEAKKTSVVILDKTMNHVESTDGKTLQGEVENSSNASLEMNEASDHRVKILGLNEVFHHTCIKTYEDLMKNEDILHEQLMDLMKILDRVYLNSHVVNFIRKAQIFFTKLRDVVRTYMDIIKELSRKFFNKNIGNADLPAQLAQILVSADTLTAALDASNHAHLDTIDDREETMLERIEGWHSELMEELRVEEVQRHRRCVNEICHLIDINREELDDIVGDVVMVDEDLFL